MSAADNAVQEEPIDNREMVSRMLDQPRTYTEERGLIWDEAMLVPSSGHLSVVWRRYAWEAADVHTIGCERECKRRDDPNRSVQTYMGFVSAIVGKIREVKTETGHSLCVKYLPKEGIHHAGISFLPVPGVEFKKNDRTALRASLGAVFKAFGPMIAHRCKGAAP